MLERIRKGELSGVVHCGELVELSARVPAYEPSRSRVVLPFRGEGTGYGFRFSMRDGKYVVKLRVTLKRKGPRRRFHITTNPKGFTSLCNTDPSWGEKRIELLVAAKDFNSEYFQRQGSPNVCLSCIRKGSTIIEITEAESR